MGYGAEAETVNASTGRPANNALKLTSLASPGGLGSQLNAVLAGPRLALTRHTADLTSDPLLLDCPLNASTHLNDGTLGLSC